MNDGNNVNDGNRIVSSVAALLHLHGAHQHITPESLLPEYYAEQQSSNICGTGSRLIKIDWHIH